MNCTGHNVKVTEGNTFALILPLKSRHYIAEQPIDTDIDILMLQDVVVKVGGVTWQDVTLTTQGVSIAIPATQARGTYNVELTALYNNIRIRAAYFECFTIVAWSYQSDVQNYIPDSPIVAEAAFIVAGNWTNAELEALEAELRQAIADAQQAQADAEAAKEHYDQLAEQLTGVAQEQTLTDGVTAIREDISHIDIDTSDLAKQGTNPNATNTAILEAIQQGGSPADALETEVEAGKAAIVDAIEDKGGTATTTMSLTQMAAAIDGIQVPNPMRLTSVSFVNSVNNEVIDMGAIEYINVATFNFSNFTTVKKIRNFPQLPLINNFNNMFQNCYALEEVEFGNRLDTHNIIYFTNVFSNCTSLLEVDFSQIDTSALGSCNTFIFNCSSLKKAILPNFHFVGYVYYFIRSSPLVEYVDLKGSVASGFTQASAIFDTPLLQTLVGDSTYQEVVDGNIGIFIGLNASLNLNFAQCPNLNVASLRALINGLADRTGQSALSFSMGNTNIAKLSADDIAVATNKNWTLA